MPLPRTISLTVALLVASAYAQPTRDMPEPPRVEPREPAPDALALQRRAMLRASLKMQPDSGLAREAPPASVRLLSDQERAALRQQLRQQ